MNIEDNNIHIWQLTVKDFISEIDDFLQILSNDEKKRAKRFKFPQHRDNYIITHGVLRKLLGQYLNQPPQDIIFIYNDHGKPSINNKIHFNMSHSKDLALFAFSNNQIGVDIEYIKPKIEYEELAKRFFSAQEYQAIMQTPAETRKKAFFNCWTCKEAFIKAIGEGLSFPLKDFDVAINANNNKSLLLNIHNSNYNPQNWSLFNISINNHYKAAVAVNAIINSKNIKKLTYKA